VGNGFGVCAGAKAHFFIRHLRFVNIRGIRVALLPLSVFESFAPVGALKG
jgi:hypothetical protein